MTIHQMDIVMPYVTDPIQSSLRERSMLLEVPVPNGAEREEEDDHAFSDEVSISDEARALLAAEQAEAGDAASEATEQAAREDSGS